ncbi:MAG: glycosyltransferase family 2 protein [Chitinophagaceae bacterium]|nr:glycosyltransferase family 2 protein [Chitinophagaceae bacterium]
MLVSIIIPCYNAAPYVAETIESIIAQTYTNWECIIIDDHSTDNSWQIIESYQQRYPEKIFIYKNPRKGACAARNTGVDYAKGEYIQFMDADDVMNINKLKNQILLVEKFGNDFIYSSQWIPFKKNIPTVIPEKSAIDNNFDSPVDWLVTSWLYISGQTAIWLTPRILIEKAGKWNETLVMNDDGEYFFRVLLQCKGIKFADEAYVFYRRDVENSITKIISSSKIEDILKTYQSYEQILTLEDSKRVRTALVHNYASFIYSYGNKRKDLAKIAWKRIDNLGITINSKIGGKKFQKLASIIGTTSALKIKSLF